MMVCFAGLSCITARPDPEPVNASPRFRGSVLPCELEPAAPSFRGSVRLCVLAPASAKEARSPSFRGNARLCSLPPATTKEGTPSTARPGFRAHVAPAATDEAPLFDGLEANLLRSSDAVDDDAPTRPSERLVAMNTFRQPAYDDPSFAYDRRPAAPTFWADPQNLYFNWPGAQRYRNDPYSSRNDPYSDGNDPPWSRNDPYWYRKPQFGNVNDPSADRDNRYVEGQEPPWYRNDPYWYLKPQFGNRNDPYANGSNPYENPTLGYTRLVPLNESLLGEFSFGRYPFRGEPNFFNFSYNNSRSSLRAGPLSVNFGLSNGVTYSHTKVTSSQNSGQNADANSFQFSSRVFPEVGRNLGNGFQGITSGYVGFYLGNSVGGPSIRGSYNIAYRYPDLGSGSSSGSGSGANSGSSGRQGSNGLDQELFILANLPMDRWNFGLGFAYVRDEGPNRDAGGNADHSIITISPTAYYTYSPKTSFDFRIDLPITETSQSSGTQDISGTAFINYRVDDRVSVGAGLGLGLSNFGGLNETFEQALLRASYYLSARLTLSLQGGLEFRQIGSVTRIAPIFSLVADYSPRVGTIFSLNAERTVDNTSLSSETNFDSNSFSLAIRQRLGNKMAASLTGAYEHANYGAAQGSGRRRVDDLFTGEIGLQAQITTHWSTTLSYSYTENLSNTNGFQSSRAQFLVNFAF